jgi:hypothetical protein
MGWRTNVHDEERSGPLSVVSDDISESETILELSCEFTQISSTVLYKMITVRLGDHKFWARWVPETLTGEHKKQRMASALTI